MSFRACPERIKKPLENPTDFPGAKKRRLVVRDAWLKPLIETTSLNAVISSMLVGLYKFLYPTEN
jgi:hypothetical protein